MEALWECAHERAWLTDWHTPQSEIVIVKLSCAHLRWDVYIKSQKKIKKQILKEYILKYIVRKFSKSVKDHNKIWLFH